MKSAQDILLPQIIERAPGPLILDATLAAQGLKRSDLARDVALATGWAERNALVRIGTLCSGGRPDYRLREVLDQILRIPQQAWDRKP